MKGNSSHKRTARAQEIQYNVVRLALVIFFVATVSAAGGFLQGERVAVERVAQTQQATAVAHAEQRKVPPEFKGVKGVRFDQHMTLCSKFNPFMCHDTAFEDQIYYPLKSGEKELRYYPDVGEGTYILGENCKSGDGCEASTEYANGDDPAVQDFLSKFNKGAPNKITRGLGVNDGKKSDNSNEDLKKKDAKSFACKDNPSSLSCKNICSTTYVTLGVSGEKPEEIDCSPTDLIPGGSGASEGNELWKKIRTYAQQCSGGGNAKQIAGRKCLGELPPLPEKKPKESPEPKQKAKEIKSSLSSINNLAALSAAQCTKLEREIDALIAKGRTSGAGSASNADKAACVYKGAVVCFKEGSSVADSEFSKTKPLQGVKDGGKKKIVQKDKTAKWKCVPKKDAGKKVPPVGDQCAGKTGVAKDFCNYKKSIDEKLRSLRDNLRQNNTGKGVGKSPFGQQKKPPTGKKNTPPKQQPKGCPAGHVQTQQNGRTVCVKPVKPQCVIAASKEEINAGETVTIRWRTANAEKVAISDIGDSVPKNSQKSVRPSKTTTYTLTATGRGDTKETCDVTVTVDGESNSDSSGAAPPKLSCTPGTILKGKSAKVKWACTSRADTSEGMGIDTDGKLGGEVTVTPEHNTQYTVKCLEDGQEIGKNICSVTVGEPTYDILVHPTTAKRGDRVRVSWASLFMKSCRVQGPRGFDYTRNQGVVITEPFSTDEERVPNRTIRAAIYSIECESEFGGRVSKDVTVEFEE